MNIKKIKKNLITATDTCDIRQCQRAYNGITVMLVVRCGSV